MQRVCSEGQSGSIGALVCAVAVAAVPLFGHTEGLTIIPQAIAGVASCLAALAFVVRIPRIHIGILAFATLLVFWGITLVDYRSVWVLFQSFAKMSVVAFSAHVLCRTRRDLLMLFGVFGATGLLSVALNWSDLIDLSATVAGEQSLEDKDRFAGTFGNANTAGIYGSTVLLVTLIFFFNRRGWFRWPVLLSGVGGGLAILYFTGSRKAMLGMVLTVLFLPLIATRARQGRRFPWLRVLLLSIIAAVICALLFDKIPFARRLVIELHEGVDAEASSRDRWSMLLAAVRLWQEHPLVGCGFEGFRRLSGFGVYSHCTFTEVLCNGGVFGASLLALFYLVPGIQLARVVGLGRQNGDRSLHIGLLALWLQYVLFSAFHVMWTNADNLCLYMAICGYLSNQERGAEVRKNAIFVLPKEADSDLLRTTREHNIS